MKHEEMMKKAWKFIQDAGITEDVDEYENNNSLILVKNIYHVRDAYYLDLENDKIRTDEDVFQFLDRHRIEYK